MSGRSMRSGGMPRIGVVVDSNDPVPELILSLRERELAERYDRYAVNGNGAG